MSIRIIWHNLLLEIERVENTGVDQIFHLESMSKYTFTRSNTATLDTSQDKLSFSLDF